MIRKKKEFRDWFNVAAVIWIIISEIFLHAFCLKDLKIFVPEAVVMGNAATLTCQYDLGQAALYSVRWYFEGEEFYRYVPKESPPSIVFPVSGITVDVSSSDSTSVTLRGVNRGLTGKFQCEVSEDAPRFHTEIRAAHLQVVELPKDEPFIQIDKKNISINDNFKAVCFVGKSYPPANITWYINDEKIKRDPHQRIVYRPYDTSPTISSMEIKSSSPLLQKLFQTLPTKYKYHQQHQSQPPPSPRQQQQQPLQTLNITCEVSIHHVYHSSAHANLIMMYPTSMSSSSSHIPNLFNPEKAIGDPDNSPLTGGCSTQPNVYYVIFLILCCFYFGYNSIL